MKSRSMIFGRNLKTLRESKGLSQEQAAKMVGLSIAQYNRTEAGKTTIDLDRVALFCDTFGVPEGVLLLGVFDQPEIDTEKETLLNAILALGKSCSSSSLRLLLRITQDVYQHDGELNVEHHHII